METTINKITLPNVRIAAVFKMLIDHSQVEAANASGIDKYFKTSKEIQSYMYRMFLKVKLNPEKFGVLPETVLAVDEAMKRRNSANQSPYSEMAIESEFEKLSNIKEADIKGIIVTGRNKAAILIDKKMNLLLKSKKALEKESLVNLAKVFGIYFDKGQIIQGQATENIAVLSKVSDGLTPEEAMEALIKSREKIMEDKHD